jgi:hypothetical protein
MSQIVTGHESWVRRNGLIQEELGCSGGGKGSGFGDLAGVGMNNGMQSAVLQFGLDQCPERFNIGVMRVSVV